MLIRIATIARYVLLEAARAKFPLLVVLVVGILLGASFFISEIAIAESLRFQTAFYAASARYAAVAMTALYAISSITREFNDKGLEITLALDLPPSHYILGKLTGLLAVAALLALIAGLPLVVLAGWQPAAQWIASLGCELAIICALSLFCVISFNQVTPAFSVVLGFYLFARALTAIRLMSAHPVSEISAASHRIMTWLVEALALVVPALDRWTRTEWLVDAMPSWQVILAIAAQSALFVMIAASATIFDMHRREF